MHYKGKIVTAAVRSVRHHHNQMITVNIAGNWDKSTLRTTSWGAMGRMQHHFCDTPAKVSKSELHSKGGMGETQNERRSTG